MTLLRHWPLAALPVCLAADLGLTASLCITALIWAADYSIARNERAEQNRMNWENT